MTERPILFSGPMVRALLDGSKTQTRRLVKPQPTGFLGGPGVTMRDGTPAPLIPMDETVPPYGREIPCPYGKPGDRLWVREAHSLENRYRNVWCRYRADDAHVAVLAPQLVDVVRPGWRSSIHMPRWASRITLEVTEVRVERLQDISEADAKAEGCEPLAWSIPDGKAADLIDWPLKAVDRPYANAYALLWQSINGPGSWDANPWVWAISFKRVTP